MFNELCFDWSKSNLLSILILSHGVDSVSYKLVKITKMSKFTGIYIILLVNT